MGSSDSGAVGRLLSGAMTIDPDPYPSGIYSVLSYPAAPTTTGSAPATPATTGGPEDRPTGTVPAQRSAASQTTTSRSAPSQATAPQAAALRATAQRPVEDVVAHVGDIDLTQWTVRTPVGAAPLGAVTWTVTDEAARRSPTWAFVAAILGFFVVGPLSLLFLLVWETVGTGTAVVVVTAGDLDHETVVSDPEEAALARSLAAGNPSAVD